MTEHCEDCKELTADPHFPTADESDFDIVCPECCVRCREEEVSDA